MLKLKAERMKKITESAVEESAIAWFEELQ